MRDEIIVFVVGMSCINVVFEIRGGFYICYIMFWKFGVDVDLLFIGIIRMLDVGVYCVYI